MRLSQRLFAHGSIVGRRAIVAPILERHASAVALAAFCVAVPLAVEAEPMVVGNLLQEATSAQCGDQSTCSLLFSAAPSGKTLVVTDVACNIVFSNVAATVPYGAQLTSRKTNGALDDRRSYPKPLFEAVKNNSKVYRIQDKVRHIVLAGQQPHISVGLTAAAHTFGVSCTLTGDLF